MVNLGAKGALLKNVSTNTGHWVDIKLIGAMRPGDRNSAPGPAAKSNRDGIGARVEIVAGGRRQTAERVASSGYLSQNDGRLHFGLGEASTVDQITVRWPSGKVQTLAGQAADRVITVEEPQ